MLQVHGQKAGWEDPVEWVRGTLPWPSAQQDQAKLFHLPPPSIDSSSPGQSLEERPHKETPPSSMESDPLVRSSTSLWICLNTFFFFFYSTCLSFLRWLCFWNFKKRQIISSHQKKKTLASRNFELLHSGKNDLVKMVLESFNLSFQQWSRVIRNPLISFKRLFINIHQMHRTSFIFILPFATLQLVLSHYEIYHLRKYRLQVISLATHVLDLMHVQVHNRLCT